VAAYDEAAKNARRCFDKKGLCESLSLFTRRPHGEIWPEAQLHMTYVMILNKSVPADIGEVKRLLQDIVWHLCTL